MGLLNLIVAPLQIVAAVLAFGTGTTFEQATAKTVSDPPIVPAGYAFVIWSVIYVGSVVYGIYQYAPSLAHDAFLKRIRPLTASAFAATTCWLGAARYGRTGLTVICIFWLAASLLPVFVSLMSESRRFSNVEQAAMVVPLSIYTGWVMIAIFANTSAFLNEMGVLDRFLSPTLWAMIMLVVAGAIAAQLTLSSANIPFTLTVCWALIAILVANLTREYHPEVAITCALMAAAQLFSLAISRRLRRMI